MKKRTYPTEIDIIATDKSEKNFIICKCKFRPELFDNEELRNFFKDKIENIYNNSKSGEHLDAEEIKSLEQENNEFNGRY